MLCIAMMASAAPSVSFCLAENSAVTSGAVATVTGINFSTLDSTASLHVASNACSTAGWSSATSVACVVDASSEAGVGKNVVATVSGVVGTRTQVFSFDGSPFGSAAALSALMVLVVLVVLMVLVSFVWRLWRLFGACLANVAFVVH